VFALSVVVRTGLRYSAGALSVGELLLWDGLWFAVAIFVCWRSPKTDHLCSMKIDQGWSPTGEARRQ
jgi:hypothetical protein